MSEKNLELKDKVSQIIDFVVGKHYRNLEDHFDVYALTDVIDEALRGYKDFSDKERRAALAEKDAEYAALKNSSDFFDNQYYAIKKENSELKELIEKTAMYTIKPLNEMCDQKDKRIEELEVSLVYAKGKVQDIQSKLDQGARQLEACVDEIKQALNKRGNG